MWYCHILESCKKKHAMDFHFLKIDKYKLTSLKNVSEAAASYYPLSKNTNADDILT